MDVAPPPPVDEGGRGTDGQVHPVLVTHDAQIAGEVRAAVPQLRVLGAGAHHRGIGAAADHRRVGPVQTAPVHRHRPVGLVGGDHVVGGGEGGALEREEQRQGQAAITAEPGPVDLGTQVVVVEDEPDAAPPVPAGEGEVRVRRVAGLHDLEGVLPPESPRQASGLEPRVDALQEEARRAPSLGCRPVLEQQNAVEDLPVRIAGTLGADDRDAIAGSRQRLALQPHPAVEGDGEVLDDDEDVAAVLRRTGGHRAHWVIWA